MAKSSHAVVVSDGGSLSSAARLRGGSPKSIYVPPGAAGSWLAFQRTESAAAGYCRGWDGNKLTAAFVAGSWLELDAADIAAADMIAVELCSDEAGTPAPQTGAITVTIVAI